MIRNLILVLAISIISINGFGQGVFHSTGASTVWNSATAWTLFSGTDADGIPDANDDVRIKTGHNIIVGGNAIWNSIIIDNGGTYTGANQNLTLKGNFTNNGTATGVVFVFTNAVSTISTSTPLTFNRMTTFQSTVTIQAGSQFLCNGATGFSLGNSTIFNNNGTLSIKSIYNNAPGTIPIFNNKSGAILNLSSNRFAGQPYVTFVSSNNSTVNLSSTVTEIPSYTFNILNLLGSGTTKTPVVGLVATGAVTINSGVILNLNSLSCTLGGNLSNSGSITNLNNLTFNGTASQTIVSPQVHNIAVLNSTNPATIILNSGTYNISTSASFTGSLNLNAAGVTFNLNSHLLTIGGNLTNSGNITNTAAVTFNGTSAQTISFTNNLAFTDMISSNVMGVSITSGSHTISNSLTVTSGNLNVGTNLVTLVSNVAKTAYIAQSAGTMSGSMIVQRYVPAGVEAYHDFSSPVASTTIDDWDDELYMTIGAANNVPGYPGGDGMLSTDPTYFSVTTYDTHNDTYPNVTTGTTLGVGTGYTVWVADDMTSFPGRAIDSRGTPNMGTVLVPVIFDAANPTFPGWNLIGNPHASFISWADVVAASTNVNTNIQIYDGSGNYVDDLTQPDIAPGQGFYCQVTANTSVHFPQSCKRTTTASTFLRPTSNYDLKLRLSSSANPYYHEINLNFDENSAVGFELDKDIPFLKSPKQVAPYITFTDGAHKFIRNKMNTTSSVVTLPLEISTPISGNYSIELMGLLSNNVYTEAYIVNTNTGEQTAISDANTVTLYFEKGTTSTNYSLVLKKANAPAFSPNGEAVSIFSTANNITIKGYLETAQTVKVEVYDIIGQLVMSTSSELAVNGTINLPVSDLKSEVYVVKVTTDKNLQFTKKVVVTK